MAGSDQWHHAHNEQKRHSWDHNYVSTQFEKDHEMCKATAGGDHTQGSPSMTCQIVYNIVTLISLIIFFNYLNDQARLSKAYSGENRVAQFAWI